MKIFDSFLKLFRKKVIYPEVGMKLEDPIWGRSWTEVEVVQISKDKKHIKYKFNVISGTINNLVDSVYTAPWSSFSKYSYHIIE